MDREVVSSSFFAFSMRMLVRYARKFTPISLLNSWLMYCGFRWNSSASTERLISSARCSCRYRVRPVMVRSSCFSGSSAADTLRSNSEIFMLSMQLPNSS